MGQCRRGPSLRTTHLYYLTVKVFKRTCQVMKHPSSSHNRPQGTFLRKLRMRLNHWFWTSQILVFFFCLDQANRWLTLPHLSPQVLIIFSDGLDEDVMRLEQESELLRKSSKKINKNKVCSDEIQNWWTSGWRSVLHVSRLFLVWVDINALLVVALEGARNPAELQMVEFGRGFGYKLPLSIGMPSVGSTILKQIVSASCHRSLTKPRAVHSHLYLTPAVSKEPSYPHHPPTPPMTQ